MSVAAAAPPSLLCDDGEALSLGSARSLRDGVLRLTLDHQVAPGHLLSITPTPEETGRLFSIEGEVLKCASPLAGEWCVALQLTSVAPGDLETLRIILAS